MDRTLFKVNQRKRRALHVRRQVSGTQERPRLAVFRSLKNIYCQVIDDVGGVTLVAANTKMKDVAANLKSGGNVAAAKAVGKFVAQKAKEKGITKVVFDRAGYMYHGRIKALADGAREGGLQF